MRIGSKEIISVDDKQNKRFIDSQIKRDPLFIIFCIPGNAFSNKFINCLFKTFQFCNMNKIGFALSCEYSSMVQFARNKCLGGNVLQGHRQLPFNGAIEYTHLMWIDSDMVWSPNQIAMLLNRNVSIISGLYRISPDNNSLCAVKNWDKDVFLKNGHFDFLKYSDIKDEKELIKVAYTGFGFMLIKRGIFESIEYPWFRSVKQEINDEIVDFASEDVSICLTMQDKNLDVFVDPTVLVGHEKKTVWI